MITQSTDTNPEAERFLISLIRASSVKERFMHMQSFTSSIIQLSKRAISRANPGLNEKEKNILFVKYHYGEDLAEKLSKYLSQNNL